MRTTFIDYLDELGIKCYARTNNPIGFGLENEETFKTINY